MDFMEALKAQKEEFETSEQDKIAEELKKHEELNRKMDLEDEKEVEFAVKKHPKDAAELNQRQESSITAELSEEYKAKLEELLMLDQNDSFSDLYYARTGLDSEARNKQSQKEAASYFMQYMGWV